MKGPISAYAEEPARNQHELGGRWAYLRVRGGTPVVESGVGALVGLSPRTRRNPSRAILVREGAGPISAYAEEPLHRTQDHRLSGAYLRVRGGTSFCAASTTGEGGLSPRARRNPHRDHVQKRAPGPISACAEEPRPGPRSTLRCRAYLRVRGGTGCCGRCWAAHGGLSPRARRNRACAHRHPRWRGPISACAEEPWGLERAQDSDGVYLRVRGGTADQIGADPPMGGLSPRARRNRGICVVHHEIDGPISACAEEPILARTRARKSSAYLRVRGGTTSTFNLPDTRGGLSPRARRNRSHRELTGERRGPISACAEEPVASRCRSVFSRAYLRVRGGTPCLLRHLHEKAGLSPRARRNQRRRRAAQGTGGPISACAEEP